MDIFAFPLIAFIAVVVLIPLAIKIAPALKLIDVPDSRKQHEGDVPLIGGLIIFPVFIVCAHFAGFSMVVYWPLYTAIALLLAVGAVDDKYQVHAWTKFFLQFVAAALVILLGEARLHQLGDLFGFGLFGLDFMWLPFSFAAVVLLINAVNLMDGLDGLASGFCAVALSWVAVGLYMAGDTVGLTNILILIAAIAGFLVYNLRHPFRKKASLFLGDAGSLCLGLCLAWFSIHAGKHPVSAPLAPMSVAWILAIPIFDTCAQFYRRKREGRHPFSPDRGHFHHHFVHAGMADGRAVAMILCLAVITGAVGVLGLKLGVHPAIITLSWIVGLLAHMAYSNKPERYIALISKIFKT
jgi:UDP-GlcNAc:undecaprenyl-phosphate GlcNAc-1-phosphate transferase